MITGLAAALWLSAAPVELEHDLRWELPVTAGLGAWWMLSEFVFKEELAPRDCKWCARNGFDDAVARAIGAPLDRQKNAALASDFIGIGLTPALMLGTSLVFSLREDATWRQAALDVFFILQAMVASQALNQAVKFLAGRERPLVAALPASEKHMTAEPEDNNLSFFSGHTAYTFSLVAATATVLRARGYERWWLAIVIGAPLAATTAVLRMVADKHYLTDVLTGIALGTIFGIGVPTIFHRPVKVGEVTAWLTPGLGGVSLNGKW